MGYYDPPEDKYDDFEGCPLCKADNWLDVPPTDANYEKLNDKYRCGNCGLYHDTAMEFFDRLLNVIPPEPEPEPEYEPLTPEQLEELGHIFAEAEVKRLTDLGLLDDNGEPTDEFYRQADLAYNQRR